MRWRIKILVAFVLLVLAASSAAAVSVVRQPDPEAATNLTIDQLWTDSQAYYGHTITTSGTVRAYRTAPHGPYVVLASPNKHEVGLRGVAWERLAPCSGLTATVTGTFNFHPTFGLNLQITRFVPNGDKQGCRAIGVATPIAAG